MLSSVITTSWGRHPRDWSLRSGPSLTLEYLLNSTGPLGTV